MENDTNSFVSLATLRRDLDAREKIGIAQKVKVY
jgi:hypothetical protein